MRRFIPLAIFLVIVAGLFTAAWYWGDGDWGPDRDRTHVVRVVDDQGQPIGDGNTVIIDRDRGPFFFPFGLFLIPLFIFLLFWTFGRRGRPYGPNGYPTDTPPQWFEHWYEQMRRREQNRSTPPRDE
jgi:hypothetical protein